MDFARILEIFGFIVGLAYLWWEYHADARVWIASVIMPAISLWIYFSKGIYADFAINIYYLAIAAYPYPAGNRGCGYKNHNNPRAIAHTPLPVWAGVTAASAVLWLALYFVLSRYTDSTIPRLDAFTTALSVVAMWMMARKYAEQWLVWLVVDIVSTGLYIYKGLIFYPVLYAAYSVIAILRYRKGLALLNQPQCPLPAAL